MSNSRDPAYWKAYAASPFLADLPYISSKAVVGNKYTQRDVFVNATDFLNQKAPLCTVYADVVGFEWSNVTVPLHKGGDLVIFTRVLTSDSPLTLTISPETTDKAVIMIWASQLDQPVSIAMESASPIPLNLGNGSTNLGATITIQNGALSISYSSKYSVLGSADALSSAQTQLRIASILFWTDDSLAKAITTHVALITTHSQLAATMNLQANALNQQLNASQLTGPRASYAPVLKLATYKDTLDGAINVAAAFETQFDRFTDRQSSIADQKAAWDTMLARAQNSVDLQNTLAQEASVKFDSAVATLDKASDDFNTQQRALRDAAATFQVGLEMWKEHQILKAVFDIVSSVIMLAVAIGACFIMPTAAAAVPAEANAALIGCKTAAQAAEETMADAKELKETVENIKNAVEAGFATVESAVKIVELAKQLSEDRSVQPSTLDQTPTADAESANLVTLAAWDDWRVEADAQIALCVEKKVEGASEYQTELRKHATAGKLISQLRAEAAKAGLEYGHLLLSLKAAQSDLVNLQKLRATYNGELAAAEQARAGFYDRMMSIRTSILIEMRKATWAYQYLSLSHSSVKLDPLKSIDDLRADASLIVQEVETWQEMQSSDFSPFTPDPILISQLFSTSSGALINLLKTTGKATFTLAPKTLSSNDQTVISGPFVDGTHFRIYGMRAYLVGAKPRAASGSSISVQIASAGLYSDVGDDSIWAFQMTPLSRPFQYKDDSGAAASSSSSIIIDSIFEGKEHVDPTPFTTWTISLKTPDAVDLTGLTDIKLVWQGSARFS